ncbi:hypothetical protein BDP27DRAFT_1424925 [Rhodocollybia butyracea]|uniref:Uncharacterized protein n=1 Tax=Rhodocollybia butyracea TaxID=206335 RepID=A0A9P5PLF8_9AGAR|nr:hypothetical protein BDP27DRAFT_1424925 [Rhodocollybia butyracea]
MKSVVWKEMRVNDPVDASQANANLEAAVSSATQALIDKIGDFIETEHPNTSLEDEDMVLWRKGLLAFNQEVSGSGTVLPQKDSGDDSGDESLDNEAASKKKKKKAVMGEAECQAAKQKKLCVAIEKATLGLEQEFEKIAVENNVKVERVKQLALFNLLMKLKKEVSDWNIMLYFKGQDDEDKTKGSRAKLLDIQEALRNNPVLKAIRDNPEKMGEYWQRYHDEKKDKANSKLHRLTPKAMSQAASKSLSLLQDQCNYAFENSGSNTLGVITRSAFDVQTAKGFFGTGPTDDFLREHFNVTILGFPELFDSFVCKRKEMGRKKLSAANMTKATILMIQQGLHESRFFWL